LGFNLIKLCLFVPNPVYFDIADEEGMLLWLEFPMWLPEVSKDLRVMAPGEYAEITQLVRHHPSLVLYSLGCELSQAVDGEFLGALNQAVRGNVSNVLVCDNSGSGESYGGLDFDFSDFTDYHPYYDLHYFEPLLDQWRRDWQKPRPWIFGEFRLRHSD
jgi:beta-galactosidase/beta-glucuronidase